MPTCALSEAHVSMNADPQCGSPFMATAACGKAHVSMNADPHVGRHSWRLRLQRGTRRHECRPTSIDPRSSAMTVIKQDDLIASVADALQFISYYHPVDFIQAMHKAWQREQNTGGEGRDRADPDQLAHVRAGPPPDLPGHRHRDRVRDGGHGRALGRRHDGPRRDDQRGRAPRVPEPRQRAARLDPRRPGRRAQEHQGQHARR